MRIYDTFIATSLAKGNAMRNILALILALTCFAASADEALGPVITGPVAEHTMERIKYIRRVAFLFRLNTDFRISSTIVENPETTVRLYFKGDGKLEKYIIERGSGDPSFDMAVGFALQKSIPQLPPAPVEPGNKPFTILIRVCALC